MDQRSGKGPNQKNMKKAILFTAFIGAALLGQAQQDVLFSHFMYKKAVANPGYVGSSGHPVFSFIHRQQWAGLEGAPMTQALSFSTPAFGERVGLGLTLINDNIAYFNSSYLNLQYAYRMAIGEGSLGLGLQGSMRYFRTDWGEVETIHAGDNNVGTDRVVHPIFNVGFGAYYETNKFYVGASVPRFLKKGLGENNQGITSTRTGEVPHYYFMAGYLADLSPNVKIKPALMARYVAHSPLDVDLHCALGFKEKYWIGATYRWGVTKVPNFHGGLDLLAQYQVNDRLLVGMGYGVSLSSIQPSNVGTYEIMLQYSVVRDGKGVRNPRFF